MTTPSSSIGIISYPGRIGDGLYQLTFLRALRNAFPKAHVTWMVSNGHSTPYAGALKTLSAPYIDEIIENLPLGRKTSDLFTPLGITQRFSLLFDIRRRWRPALIARLKLPHDVFIAPAAGYLFSDVRPRSLKQPQHIVDKLLQMVELASGAPPILDTKIHLPERVLEETRAMFVPNKTYIGFAPGAGDKRKIWPLENYLEVARIQKEKGREVVFILGPDEKPIQDTIAAALPGALFPLQTLEANGTVLSLEHTIALALHLHATVSNDNGTSHMLAAGDGRLVSLFGRTRWQKLAPKVTHGKIIASEFYGSEDIAAIPTQAVALAIEELLAS